MTADSVKKKENRQSTLTSTLTSNVVPGFGMVGDLEVNSRTSQLNADFSNALQFSIFIHSILHT